MASERTTTATEQMATLVEQRARRAATLQRDLAQVH
jgi:hypothetical protein